MTAIVKFGPLSDEVYRRDLLDNATEYLIVGNIAVDRQICIEYTLDLPIGNRSQTGKIVIIQDADGVDLDHHYSFAIPEFDEVNFDVDISGTNIRLLIECTSLGENPVFLYRRSKIQVA
ncbi:MAG: hypothetical protein JW704_02500 [Anaerolineaceae bacterium]|nr:hypothetical protein [Anaerolineaceae bacterium]